LSATTIFIGGWILCSQFPFAAAASRHFRGDERIGGSSECQTPSDKRYSRKLARMSQRKRCGSQNEPFAGHGRGPRWAAANFFVIVFDSFASLLPPIRILQLAD
jgi:hypothetical protein